MCGFVGYIDGGETQLMEPVLHAMADRIRHRGPDDADYYMDGEISLGFRRLSIIDLEGGRQPILNEDKSKVLMFNGEIYNYQSLREDLLKAGHVFTTKTDSEVLLHGFEEYGTDLLNKLRGIYEFECISEELLMRLSIKESFYQVCEEHGFSFPKTTTCTYENHKNLELPFDFPVIIKPSNSVAYWNCKFPHKKKVFVANTREEFDAILDAIYGSSYKDHLILQEFIPGDDSKMRVMNCYCGKDKKVKLIALGNAVLEEHSPEGIGSYAAIINGYDEKLNETMKNFLEGIGYVGFANFDMKYDERDGKYKLFEMNLRQGRSSYFVTAAGYNIAKWLADDVIYNRPMDLTIATNKVLYTIIPTKIIFDYCPDTAVKAEAKKLIDEGKVVNSYYYKKDRSLMRWLMFRRNQHNYFEKYKRYFNNKGLRD